MDRKKFKDNWKKLGKMTQEELNKFILEDNEEQDKGEEDGRKQVDKDNERGD